MKSIIHTIRHWGIVGKKKFDSAWGGFITKKSGTAWASTDLKKKDELSIGQHLPKSARPWLLPELTGYVLSLLILSIKSDNSFGHDFEIFPK